jgi:hypothetical protein
MVGRAHCSAEDRALIRASARDLGLFPTDSFYRPIQAAGSMFHSANGGDLKQTSGYLGHGSVDITGDTYLHIPQETERANVAKLESAMFPSGGPNLLGNVSKLASA